MTATSLDTCARDVLEAVPLVMHAVRTEMRGNRGADLSVPQFRALRFLHRQAGASLSAAAEHIGVTLPSMSALVDGLVARKLIARGADPADRRRIVLTLTPRGASVLERARGEAQAHLAEKLAALSPEERACVAQAMGLLRAVFMPEEAGR